MSPTPALWDEIGWEESPSCTARVAPRRGRRRNARREAQPGPGADGIRAAGAMDPPHGNAARLDSLGLLPGNAHELDQLMQDGIRDVLGGSQGSLMPLPGLPEGTPLPIVDQHGHLQLGSLELPPMPGEPDVASQVRDTNCSAPRRQAPPSAPMSEDEVDQDEEDDDEDDDGGAAAAAEAGNETGSSGRPARGVKRKKAGKPAGKRPSAPGMQGRFSGRLGTKEDEKRLAAECRLIGPLLGGATRGEKSLHTLAKIVRAIAAGSVRAHLEGQETEVQELRAKLLLLSDGDGQQLLRLQDENTQLRRELAACQRRVGELEGQLAAGGRAQAFGGGLQGRADQAMHRVGSMPVLAPATLAYSGAPGAPLPLPVGSSGLPMPGGLGLPAAPPPQQLMLASAPVAALTAAQVAPVSAAGASAAQLAASLQPAGLALPDAAAVAQQQVQVLGGVQPAGQVVVGMGGAPPAMPPLMVQQAAGPAVTTLSGGALGGAKPAMTTMSEGLSGEQPGLQAGMLPVAQPQLSGPGDSAPAAAAADQAAQNLNQQAQHLTVQASLHGQAKTHATSQAQQLASQAQLHAQASVQAAVQAEQLKQTLATAVLPDTQQAQQAVATVQNLEERAKAHADITTQAVAQARELQEKAQVHAAEQVKAMAQANMLHAHAHSLAASAQQLEASAQQATSAPGSGPAASGEQMMAAPAPAHGLHAAGQLPALQPVMAQAQQPAASVNPSESGAPADAAAAAAAMAAQQTVLGASAAAPTPAPTVLPAQLPDGQVVQVVVPPQMVAHGSAPMVAPASGALAPPMVAQPSGGLAPPMVPQPSGSLAPTAGSGALPQQPLAAAPPLAAAAATMPPAVPAAPSSDSAAALQHAAAAQQTAQLQGQLAALQQAQAQQQAVQQQAAAAAAHHQAAAAAVQEQLVEVGKAAAAQAAAQTAAQAVQAVAAAQQAVAQAQMEQQAAQAQLNLAVAAAGGAAAVVTHQQSVPQAAVQQAAVQQAAAQQAAVQQATSQQAAAAAAAQQQQAQAAALAQVSGGATPVPAAASAILQPTPQSLQRAQSHAIDPSAIKMEPLGSAALPVSSGSAALMVAEAMARSGSRSAAPGGTLATPAVPGADASVSVSTGLTPQVGTLELPPGIEAIVPSDQPLTLDPSALQAAAMGPVVALPAAGRPAQAAQPSGLSLPHSASEGLPVASGSSA